MSGVEVIGAISAVIGIIDACIKVYRGAAKDLKLPEAFRVVACQLPVLADTLTTCKTYLESCKASLPSDVCVALEEILDRCDDRARNLRTIFEKVITIETDGWRKRYSKVVQRLGKGNKVEELTALIIKDVQLVVNHQAVQPAQPDQSQQEQSQRLEQILHELQQLESSLDEDDQRGCMTFVNHEGTQNNNTGDGQQFNYEDMSGKQYFSFGSVYHHHHEPSVDHGRFSRWLRVPDPSTNYQTALKTRHAETGLWLLQCPAFQQWRSSRSSLLWLHGGAGCGKTILSATALQYILQETVEQKEAVVAYFYFDFNTAEKQQYHNAIRSVLLQLAFQLPDCSQALEKLYEHCQNGQRQPSEDALQALLYSTLTRPYPTYIILDALDECTDREVLLPSIRDLVTSQQHSCRLLATSRREKDIEDELQAVAHYIIDIQSTVVDHDIAQYVHHRLRTDVKLNKWPPTIRDEIATEIMAKANGMFRWAFCQLDSLRRCVRLEGLRKALSSLPKTLDDTYTRIIRNIESSDQLPDAVRVLRWLCFSSRPLRLCEVVEALAIENGEDGGFDPKERLPDPQDVMVICSSLISYSRNSSEPDTESGRDDDHSFAGNNIDDGFSQYSRDRVLLSNDVEIRLAHFSVKEYLLSERCCLSLDFDDQSSHQAISESCLYYLLYVSGAESSTNLREEYPLLEYAAEYWWQHEQQVALPSLLNTVVLAAFLFTHERSLLLWIRHFDIETCRLSYRPNLGIDDAAPPIYYAACLGFWSITLALLKYGADVNMRRGGYYSALQIASSEGYIQIVRLLLEHGADVNALNEVKEGALVLASSHGHDQIVQLLLEHGADVNVIAYHYGSALQAASQEGHSMIVELLLNHGADINAIGGEFGSAVYAASSEGHEQVVELLLKRGARVDMQDDCKGSALLEASIQGHEQIVRLLLRHGADINAEYHFVLRAASEHGHERIVRLLLEYGADVDPLEIDDNCALVAALTGGYKEIVQLLLEQSADVNMLGEAGVSALCGASVGGNKDLVQLLLERIANVNIARGRDGSVLHDVSTESCEQIMQLLLKHGADIRARRKPFIFEPLPDSKQDHEYIVQLLKEYGFTD